MLEKMTGNSKFKRQPHFRRSIRPDQTTILKRQILSLDLIDDVGFANLAKYRKIEGGGTPLDFLPDAKIGIVYISRLERVIEKYGKWYVASLNNFLKQTNCGITQLLETHGVYSLGVIDERLTKEIVGRISFRQLAVLAGLGTIGKNSCLLHPAHGARVLIGVVLTAGHLQPDAPLEIEICWDCDICLTKCPLGAIGGDTFSRYRCKNRRKILGKACEIPCVRQCPVG